MILHQEETGRNTLSHQFPEVMTSLPRWACRRFRRKGGRARDISQAVHPIDGKEPQQKHLASWATFEEVVNHRLRRPVDGIGFCVRGDDGLAVVMNATPAVYERLSESVVYVEKAAIGDGLTLIVHADVIGALTNRFVPLSGQPPYQGHDTEVSTTSLDAVRTVSGQEPVSGQDPYQVSGQVPYQGNRVCLDNTRNLFSSSHQNNNYQEIEKQLEQFGNELLEQGKVGDEGKWVYSLISLLQVNNSRMAENTTYTLLQKFADLVGKDANDLHALVCARWEKMDPSRVLLADALRAVRADSHLLQDLDVVNPVTLQIAGMARYMGKDGKLFKLHQKSLASLLRLSQQSVSAYITSLLNEHKYLVLVHPHKYAANKPENRKAAEYAWVGPGAVCVQRAAQTMARVEPSTKCLVTSLKVRPGHSPNKTDKHYYQSLKGGWLTPEHYLAEKMLSRRLAKERRSLPHNYWDDEKIGSEYGRQVDLARKLITTYRTSVVCKVVNSQRCKSVYSLAVPWLPPLLADENRRILQEEALRATAQVEPFLPPPPMKTKPPTEKPALVYKKSMLSKLKGL